MITFKCEALSVCLDEMKALFFQHWQEVANYQDKIPLNPDYDMYRKLEENGALITVVCRRDGVVVGYSIFLVHRHLHYKDCVVAANDVLFLKPQERKGGVGLELIKESEKILSGVGVTRITWHVKPKNDFSDLFSRLGYIQEEIVMGKLLG